MSATFEKLTFSTNWNNKLDCDAFTTIRLKNAKKYKVGELYSVLHKDTFKKYARIIEIKSFKLDKINNFIAYLDTGLSAEECKKVIQTMYKKYNIDWNKQELYLILCLTHK